MEVTVASRIYRDKCIKRALQRTLLTRPTKHTQRHTLVPGAPICAIVVTQSISLVDFRFHAAASLPIRRARSAIRRHRHHGFHGGGQVEPIGNSTRSPSPRPPNRRARLSIVTAIALRAPAGSTLCRFHGVGSRNRLVAPYTHTRMGEGRIDNPISRRIIASAPERCTHTHMHTNSLDRKLARFHCV